MTLKKFSAFLMLVLIVTISILIVIIPTFFTQGISRKELHKEITLPLVLNDKKDVKIVFFGYSGCVDICSPRLHAISEIYEKLDAKGKKRVGVEFLDISLPQNENLPSDFAKSFNKDFKGIYLDEKIIRNYTKAFNVYFSQGLLDKMEYEHTTNLYIINKNRDKKEIRYIYNSFPYDSDQIHLDIKDLLDE